MRVIAALLVGLGCVACGGEPAAPDAAAPDAGPQTVEFDWIVDLPDTQVIDTVQAVPGGVVYIGQPNIIRLDDEGAVRMNKPLPEPYEYRASQVAANGDIVISFTGTVDGVPGDHLRRFDLQMLEPTWIWSYGDSFSELTSTTTDVGAIAVVRRSVNDERELFEIDGTGSAVSQPLPGLPPMTLGGPLWPTGDGSLFTIAFGDTVDRWILWPETGAWSFEPLHASDPELRVTVPTSNHLVASWGDYDGRWHLVAYDANGDVAIPLVDVPHAVVRRVEAALTSDRLWRCAGSSVTHAPRADLDSYVVQELPTRPGGNADDCTMRGGDGDRVFVAWFDQISTFDRILRIGRIATAQ